MMDPGCDWLHMGTSVQLSHTPLLCLAGAMILDHSYVES